MSLFPPEKVEYPFKQQKTNLIIYISTYAFDGSHISDKKPPNP